MMIVGVLFFGWLISSISDLLDVRPYTLSTARQTLRNAAAISMLCNPTASKISISLRLSTQRASVQARTAHELRQKLQEVRGLQVPRVHNLLQHICQMLCMALIAGRCLAAQSESAAQASWIIGTSPIMFWPFTNTHLSSRR